MSKSMPVLSKGDTVGIVAPAKAISSELVLSGKDKLESFGFNVKVGEHCSGQYHYFSGTEQERTSDLQNMLEDPDVKAIFCARGGYGCLQIVDVINWASFIRNPKWIIGFSDITVFHQHINRLGLESIHGTMPLNFKENTPESFDSLINILHGDPLNYNLSSSPENKTGKGSGKLLGGNLSILHCLLGTDDQVDYNGAILFIEDLCEPLYHIDRIFHSLRKAGVLENISGLIVGGMTDLKDTEVPFGKSYKEIILSHFPYRNIPVCFDFPAGHIPDNRALIMGRNVTLEVDQQFTKIDFTN